MKTESFEAYLRSTESTEGAAHLRTAMIDVAAIVHGCKAWFESNGLQATAADVVAMAKLVMEREAKVKAEMILKGADPAG